DVEAKAAFRTRADADGGGHRRIRRNLYAAALCCDRLHGADEAGGIAGREQLLGVVAVAATTAELLRGRKLDVQLAVGRGGGAVTAAGGLGGGLVEHFHGHGGSPLLPFWCSLDSAQFNWTQV